MAKLVVCAVFDSAVQAYGKPIFFRARGEAIRSFIDEVNRKADDNQLYQHSDDFDIRVLSMFDEEAGTFDECPVEVIARGKDVRHDAS